MYKKAKQYDAMVRLVAKHRPDLLKETRQYLAQQLEMEGSLKEAEQQYAEAGEWLSAVNMCARGCEVTPGSWVNSWELAQVSAADPCHRASTFITLHDVSRIRY